MWFLSSFLRARKPAARRYPPPTQLRIEILENRNLPSGMSALHSIGSGPGRDGGGDHGHGDFQSSSSMQIIMQDHGRGGDQGGGGTDNGGGTELKAQLTGPGGATASVEVNTADGQLELNARGLAPNVTFNVAVNGTQIGTFTTGARGRAELQLTGVNLTLPANAPITITNAAGATVLQGTFANPAEVEMDEANENEAAEPAENELAAQLTATTTTAGLSATAQFNATTKAFEVSVVGATPSTTFNVTVDNVVVGQVTTGVNGTGVLDLSPATFTVNAGSTISVAAPNTAPILSGVFGMEAENAETEVAND